MESDIKNHEFADSIAGFLVDENTDKGRIILSTSEGGWYFFDRDDVKTMANHFGLLTTHKE
jgi:hypothetical protein